MTAQNACHSISLMRNGSVKDGPPVRSSSASQADGLRRPGGFGLLFAALGLVFCVLTLGACVGKPFNVKPRPATPDPPELFAGPRTLSEGLTLQAQAVLDEDYLNETFDANLLLAGIVAVRVKLTNGAPAPLDLKRARFELKTPDGRGHRPLEAHRVFKMLISYYGITTYGIDAFKESRNDFSSYAFNQSTALAEGESRQGLVFFALPADVARAAALTLIVSRLRPGAKKNDSAMEVRLN